MQWEELNLKLQQLGEFALSNEKNKNIYSRNLSFGVYLAASELCGSYCRLAFYTQDNKKDLEMALNKLLMAAQYSSRIGLRRKTSRWLALAARVCCRLNDQILAIQIINLAHEIFEESKGNLKQEYVNSIKSELTIAEGELKLLNKNKKSQAIQDFIKSLLGAVYGLFARRTVDSIYNIARVIHDSEINGQQFLTKFNQFESTIISKDFQEKIKSNENSSSCLIEIIKFINELSKKTSMTRKQIKQLNTSELEQIFIGHSCNILNQWHNVVTTDEQSEHYLCVKIRNDYNFLKTIRR